MLTPQDLFSLYKSRQNNCQVETKHELLEIDPEAYLKRDMQKGIVYDYLEIKVKEPIES